MTLLRHRLARRFPAVSRWVGLAVLLAVSWTGSAWAGPVPASNPAERALIVYVQTGCPHCSAAKSYLADLAQQRPDLQIIFKPVDKDPQADQELVDHFRSRGLWPPGVPTFIYGDRILFGFNTPETTGPELLALIGPAEPVKPADQVETRWFGSLSASRLGLPLFTLALGLLDGFNPCATWVLLFLLSLLVHLQDRQRMALVAGTFVLVSGAVYYAFMAAWLNVFLLVGFSAPLRWFLGVLALVIGGINVKDFVAFGRGVSLSIPASAKPGLYARARTVLSAESLPAALVAVSLLAVVVNFIELLCTAGFPAIYTAVLTQQNLGVAAHYAYLGLYIAGYIADDALMVAVAVIALSSHKLTERGGAWLKLISGGVMLALGLIMLIKPEWLV